MEMLKIIFAMVFMYCMVAAAVKMCLVFFWDRDSFFGYIPLDQHYYERVMLEIDLIALFILLPILPELYYLWAKTIGRSYIRRCCESGH